MIPKVSDMQPMRKGHLTSKGVLADRLRTTALEQKEAFVFLNFENPTQESSMGYTV